MADWLSSLLAGLGSGAESLGASMSEREKRDAAAKQRAFELKMQQDENNAKLGIFDMPDFELDKNTKNAIAETGKRLNTFRTPSLDVLSNQLQLGSQGKSLTTPSVDFSIGGRSPSLPSDMSDAATNYEVSGTGASTFGTRPPSPRFDNFTDQTVMPAATPASGGGASASIAKLLQPNMAPPAPQSAAPVSAAEQELIDYGNQVRANPKARTNVASGPKSKRQQEDDDFTRALHTADRFYDQRSPARQVEFDKLKAMGPKAYLNDFDMRMTPDMGPPSSLAGSDTPPAAPLAAPPSAPSAAPMAAEAGPRTVSAPGTPTMPRTRLGSIPDVQSQLGNMPGFTGVTPENASYVMQYDPMHPEAGPIRKRFDYQAGSDYAKKKAEENLPANMLARQNVESEIANRNATEKRTTAATKDLETKSRYVSSPTGFAADLAALRRDPKNADVLSRVLSMTSGTPNQEVYHRLVEDILIKKPDPQDKRQRMTDEAELRREYDRFQQAKTAFLRDKASNKLYLPEDLKTAQDNLADQERTVNMLADRQDAYGGSPTVYRTNRTLNAAPASASPGAGTKSYTTKSGKTFVVKVP